ncbi:streptomycin biosynthesis protein StrI [Hysterangium stoloniferum]|nr:streptomycin biosynthesis protein StrI [Hysterangium stoloniferum]
MSVVPVTIAIIGAGNRGKTYASFALKNPSLCKVVAVAEPRTRTRTIFASTYQVPTSNVFTDWKDLIATGRLADAVIIAVQDSQHKDVVVACAHLGYHILCEKPLATSAEDCISMARSIKEAGNIVFAIGHVLRYSPYNKAIVDVIRSSELGKAINIVHVEPVGYFHFAHSFVRGNWSREATSSFSLLTKSCHDIDILCHYFYPATPVRVSSFGSLSHFRKSSKPAEAGTATKCLECPYEPECTFSAKKTYIEPVSQGKLGWPASVITDGPPDIENITKALQEGPYGQCVYESPNDVVDHQVVNIEFSDGSTASFTMVAFTEAICKRQTRIHFSNGELIGDMVTFTTNDFRKRVKSSHSPLSEDQGGYHGGGDMGLMRSFVNAVKQGNKELLGPGASVEDVLRAHLVVFAAEKSRREGTVVNVSDFEKDIRENMTL